MTSKRTLRRLPVAAAACAALLFSLPACAQPSAMAETASEAAAKVEKNADTGIARITLSQRAIERLELLTDTVKPGPGARTSCSPTQRCCTTRRGRPGCTSTPSHGCTSASPSR
ncbi:hypothetical protein AHiyo4_25320 [Arthrobacter sp. Hiyo4]|nr:hypothetical protein AHiyo4_25320 [Arthrobacter sp. Hiyo4]